MIFNNMKVSKSVTASLVNMTVVLLISALLSQSLYVANYGIFTLSKNTFLPTCLITI